MNEILLGYGFYQIFEMFHRFKRFIIYVYVVILSCILIPRNDIL